jgi:uncharacterized protein
MKILFYLGHPAHYHLFKNVIRKLEQNNTCKIIIKKKDILQNLLDKQKEEYTNILPEGRTNNFSGMAIGMLKRDWRLLKYCILENPDLLVGTPPEIGHVGTILRIPSLNFREDDAGIYSSLFRNLTYPWQSQILSPISCNNDKWEYKSVKYAGYHELAYLHPNNFLPDKKIVESYVQLDKPLYLIRFAELTAHHDKGISGINNTLAKKIINILSPKGRVLITTERKLSSELEPFRMSINPLDIHHVMAFSTLYIGDSQTMAAESGILGTPFIRFNGFVGKLGYLTELEDKYRLGFGISSDKPDELLNIIKKLVNTKNLKKTFSTSRKKMLVDKIDCNAFFSWFIENYPTSKKILKENPDYQYKFK